MKKFPDVSSKGVWRGVDVEMKEREIMVIIIMRYGVRQLPVLFWRDPWEPLLPGPGGTTADDVLITESAVVAFLFVGGRKLHPQLVLGPVPATRCILLLLPIPA